MCVCVCVCVTDCLNNLEIKISFDTERSEIWNEGDFHMNKKY